MLLDQMLLWQTNAFLQAYSLEGKWLYCQPFCKSWSHKVCSRLGPPMHIGSYPAEPVLFWQYVLHSLVRIQ
jgi:hypothetical protein